jgi:Tol biopolymer transport system component
VIAEDMNMRMRLIAVFILCVAGATLGVHGQTETASMLLEAARRLEVVEGDIPGAIRRYQAVVDRFAQTDRAAAALALLRMAEAYDKLGDPQAQVTYQRVVRDFADQTATASAARSRLAVAQAQSAASRVTAAQAWNDLDNLGARTGIVSADGRYISFTHQETGDVAIRELATGTVRRITHVATPWSEMADEAVVSPDGEQITYRWLVGRAGEPPTEQLRVSALRDDAAPRILFSGPGNEYFRRVSWTPDGRRLVVLRARANESQQLGLVTVADGSYQNLKSLDWREAGLLSISPDGRYVAYDVPGGDVGSPRDIFILALDGSREESLRNPANDVNPVWSADGSHLYFFSDRAGTNGLWAVALQDGRLAGAPVLIKGDIGAGATQMAATTRDVLFYFVPSPPRTNLYGGELSASGFTTPARATDRFADAAFGHLNLSPAWSKNGALLAYYSVRSEPANGALVIRTTSTGEERTIPLPPGVAAAVAPGLDGPTWFPDNRSVLVLARDGSGSGVGFYRMSIETGNTELLARVGQNVFAFDLSVDGRTIFYAVGQGTVVGVDIATARETVLKPADPTNQVLSLAVSPDGRQLAMKLLGGVMHVMPTDGGSSRELFRPAASLLGTGLMRNGLTWTPDQNFLLVTLDSELWRVAVADGRAERLDIPLTGLRAPTVHPDGRRVVFSSTQGVNANGGVMWKIENPLQRATSSNR